MKEFFKITFLLGVLMIAGAAVAIGLSKCRSRPVVSKELLPNAAVPRRGVVFKATKAGKSLFLAGSVHMLTRQDYPLPDAYEKAFNAADQIVFEVVPADFTAETMASVLLELKKDARKLSPAAEEALSAWLAEKGGSKNAFQGMEPWRVATTVAAMASKSVGLESEQGVDAYFRQKAASAGKQLHGFESLREQLGVFAGLSEQTQSEMVIQAVRESSQAATEIAVLLNAWRSGDLAALEARTAKSFAPCPEAKTAILDRRNEAWWPKLLEMADSAPVEMIIVGAAHLGGPQGLLARLREAGFDVEQL
jgi:uncharacterized protein